MLDAVGARCPFCQRPAANRTGPRRIVLHYGRRLPWAALVDEDLRRGVFSEHKRCRDKATRDLIRAAENLAGSAGVFSARLLLIEALRRVGG